MLQALDGRQVQPQNKMRCSPLVWWSNCLRKTPEPLVTSPRLVLLKKNKVALVERRWRASPPRPRPPQFSSQHLGRVCVNMWGSLRIPPAVNSSDHRALISLMSCSPASRYPQVVTSHEINACINKCFWFACIPASCFSHKSQPEHIHQSTEKKNKVLQQSLKSQKCSFFSVFRQNLFRQNKQDTVILH